MSDVGGSSELARVAEAIVGFAEPGEAVEVYVLRRRDVDVRVLNHEIESFSSAEVAGIGVRVIRDQRQGFAYAGLLGAQAGRDALAQARDNAQYGMPDEALGLVRPQDIDRDVTALDLTSPTFSDHSSQAKIDLALALEKLTFAADPRIRTVDSCDYGDAHIETAIANSNGVTANQTRTIASIAVAAIADENGESQTGFGYMLGRDMADLKPEDAAAEACARAVRLLGGTVPKSQRVPIVLDAFVAQSLLGVIGRTLDGESVIKGRSIFGESLGRQIASKAVTLVDDPLNAKSFGASSFDAEGVPTRRVNLIVEGELREFAQNVYTARRMGAAMTGSAIRGGYKSTPGVGMRSIGLHRGASSFGELLAQAQGGVFIQGVQGLHSGVNHVSGDFSVGAEGCWIRNGELAQPIRGATIASTIQEMLGQIVDVGADVRMLSTGPAVPVLIGEMTLGGS